jgi:hypothetical protein
MNAALHAHDVGWQLTVLYTLNAPYVLLKGGRNETIICNTAQPGFVVHRIGVTHLQNQARQSTAQAHLVAL